MPDKWKSNLTDQLCDSFLELTDREEVYRFLEDVATIAEIRAFAQRLEVARLLTIGRTYPQITKETGASTATISRVKKCVDFGADGFSLVLNRLSGKGKD